MQTEEQIDEVIDRALAEDLGSSDVTTDALISGSWCGKAQVVVKAAGVLAGIETAKRVFLKVDPEIQVIVLIPDGTSVKPGDVTASVAGKYAGILKAERTAINFLQHLSGIASETARYVEAVRGLPVKILDTRKTLPGLRMLAKYAVRMGGGHNHRTSLGDGVLIKDNHLLASASQGLNWKEVVAKTRREAPGHLKVEVEVRTPEEASQAAEAGTDIIMLDNMSPEAMRRAVSMVNGRALIEASGGITLANVRAVAETGVDFISIGAITHSARALDISLEFER
ncbi:carboxylating nicotinate-nucleotide diphosphorylase [Chloroflexota bacterium]